jgi:hypothetical protein
MYMTVHFTVMLCETVAVKFCRTQCVLLFPGLVLKQSRAPQEPPSRRPIEDKTGFFALWLGCASGYWRYLED